MAKYESVGGPEGDLGFPNSSEVDGGLATASRMTSFAAEDKPVIFWTPEYGATIVRGAMSAAWDRLDGAKGPLGAPMADQTEAGDIITQRFSGGVVSWDRSKNTFTTEPSNLAADLSGLEVPGQYVPEAPGASQASDSKGDKWFKLSWWWLLAIVPLVVLIGVVAFATMRRRGRGRRARTPSRRMTRSRWTAPDSAATPTNMRTAQWCARSGRRQMTTHAAAMFSDFYASEGLGSLPPRRSDVASVDDDPWGAPPAADDEEPPRSGGEASLTARADEPEADEPERGANDPDAGRRYRRGRHRAYPCAHRGGA